jgi:hypothetical protein
MSYDLMVFEPTVAPRERSDFLRWYEQQTQWSEGHGYNDLTVTSSSLRAWFMEMIGAFPPMNGPLASDDVDNPKVTDYSIGKDVIYACFAWSQVDPAFASMASLAKKHNVGFFDVSADQGAIVFPGEFDSFAKLVAATGHGKKPWWRIW